MSQVSWVGTGVLTDGRQTTDLLLCKINIRGVSGGGEERTNDCV